MRGEVRSVHHQFKQQQVLGPVHLAVVMGQPLDLMFVRISDNAQS